MAELLVKKLISLYSRFETWVWHFIAWF